jgi:hypothetical protein
LINTTEFASVLAFNNPNMACMDGLSFSLQPQLSFAYVDQQGLIHTDVTQERLNQQVYFVVSSPSGTTVQIMIMLNIVPSCTYNDVQVNQTVIDMMGGSVQLYEALNTDPTLPSIKTISDYMILSLLTFGTKYECAKLLNVELFEDASLTIISSSSQLTWDMTKMEGILKTDTEMPPTQFYLKVTTVGNL